MPGTDLLDYCCWLASAAGAIKLDPSRNDLRRATKITSKATRCADAICYWSMADYSSCPGRISLATEAHKNCRINIVTGTVFSY